MNRSLFCGSVLMGLVLFGCRTTNSASSDTKDSGDETTEVVHTCTMAANPDIGLEEPLDIKIKQDDATSFTLTMASAQMTGGVSGMEFGETTDPRSIEATLASVANVDFYETGSSDPGRVKKIHAYVGDQDGTDAQMLVFFDADANYVGSVLTLNGVGDACRR